MKLRLVAAAAVSLAVAAPACADDATDHPAYWGSPSVDGGKCCATLADVRANIDRIDRQIVALMAERGQYVAEAGRFKADPAAVSAPARVEAIVARAKALAREDGLAESVAERSYRAMIAAFEDYERDEWTRRNAGAAAPAK
jgi:isochorismate pyruvate lyase